MSQTQPTHESNSSTPAPSTPAGPRDLPLNAIRVFVEAARQLNFSRAGTVLGMTQGGVSRHVAALEACLGLRLFERQGKGVQLTDAGRQYFDTVREAIATLEWATRQWTQTRNPAARLRVRSSLPTFVHTVLIPALPAFREVSAVNVDLVTSLSAPEPGESFDVLVTRDLHLPHADQWELLQEILVCVCAPALRALYAPQPLSQWPFIHSQSRPDVLPDWARQAALQVDELTVHAGFDHYFLAIAAAIGGLGCLVVPRMLVQAQLAQGMLVMATSCEAIGSSGYRAFVHPRSAQPLQAQMFCRWLKGHLHRAQAAPPTLTADARPAP